MYSMLAELLGDEHPGVRLTAALAVQGLFDATDTGSPRANTEPGRFGGGGGGGGAPSVQRGVSMETLQGGAGGGLLGASAEAAAEGVVEEVDHLARLAASALLPVLHLSLHVREIDSRWRMGQLLCRLLMRLAAAPRLLQPHFGALTEWLPTAWAACEGEQLLQEATIDAASTMLGACPQPPLPLISASLELVALATSSGDPPAGTGGGGGGEPPVGLVEISLKLWRHCLSSIRPPMRIELAAPLLSLAARLPALLELADELVRPSMLLLDWYLLADATVGVCGNGFVQSHAHAFVPALRRAMSPVFSGPGTLAAAAATHTLLLVAPTHAACLQPALAAALTSIVAPEDDDDGNAPSELMLAAMAGVLGRALLCAPPLFSAAVAQVASELALPDVHVQFARCWVGLLDSVVLTLGRKLACLALATLLSYDAAFLPLAPDVLAFCVGVLIETHEIPVEGSDGVEPPAQGVPIPVAGEHAPFARRLAESGLDPLPALRLLPELQQRLAAASAAHGAAFEAMMQSLDPELLGQVKHAFATR